MTDMRFYSYVVKVASRCNLNCNYCYMYNHADQSWKNKPKTLSQEHQKLFSKRLREYAVEKNLKKIVVIYHGGEPLLFGAQKIIEFSEMIKEELKEVDCEADFGIQTNGTLLKEDHLIAFEKHQISVSLSIDGPKEMHDKHRLDLRNKPSFDRAYQGLQILKKYPKVFTGCIAVIDPETNPRELFQFFDENGVTDFNILLPDANYNTPPLGRDKNPNLYKDWLIKAFDCWFDHFSHLKCKYFDWLLMAVLGRKTETDSFGLGDVCLLVLETDGTYHDHDVLKITEENGSSLSLCLENNPIKDAENSDKIQFHRKLLTKSGLSPICQKCEHVDICGGGFIAHRFSKEGYTNPSIYCREIYSLINHMIAKFTQSVNNQKEKSGFDLIPEFDTSCMEQFWSSKTSKALIDDLKIHSARKNYVKLQSIIPYALKMFPEKSDLIGKYRNIGFEHIKQGLLEPTTSAWLRAFYGQSINSPAENITKELLPADPLYFDRLINYSMKSQTNDFIIQSTDSWFQLSLGSNIVLKFPDDIYEMGLKNLKKAIEIVRQYDPYMSDEMQLVTKHIQMVKDSNAHPDKDISFSDVTIPGVIFIGVWKSAGILSPYMVAASLIHEHLHQKLYLLQNRFELFTPQETLIFSPWPNVYRPPAGALHAVYVFTHVAEFWNSIIKQNLEQNLATSQFEAELKRLDQCIGDIKANVKFTRTGKLFFNCLLDKYDQLKNNNILSCV